MDKIWYRNPSKSEVIGCCDGDEKKRMTMQNRQKLNAKKIKCKLVLMIPDQGFNAFFPPDHNAKGGQTRPRKTLQSDDSWPAQQKLLRGKSKLAIKC